MHRQIAQLLHDLPPASADIARQGLMPALRELVDSEWPGAFDRVSRLRRDAQFKRSWWEFGALFYVHFSNFPERLRLETIRE